MSLRQVSDAAWLDFIERTVETLDIGPGTRVFEVGCGDGAFLFPLAENGYVVGGIDRSAESIQAASHAIPSGTFVIGEPSSPAADAFRQAAEQLASQLAILALKPQSKAIPLTQVR